MADNEYVSLWIVSCDQSVPYECTLRARDPSVFLIFLQYVYKKVRFPMQWIFREKINIYRLKQYMFYRQKHDNIVCYLEENIGRRMVNW